MSIAICKGDCVKKCFHLAALTMFAFIVAALLRIDNSGNVVTPENLVFFKSQDNISKNSKISDCNVYSGRWVYDDVLYPLYKEGNCSFSGEFSCEEYGRKDLKYQNWRWQPHHCDLPSFNGTALLENLRNKNLVFIGDSLNRNQWRSFVCLIEPYLPPSTNKTVVLEGNFFNLCIKDYNSTVRFYWSPYLVESDADDIVDHNMKSRTVRIKSIEKHGRQWTNADILIFDTFAWWAPKMTILWGSFGSPNAIYKNVELSLRLYEIVLNTWSDWLEFHIDRHKTRIFFMSLSPQRQGPMHGGCHTVTEPIFDETNWRNVPKIAMEMVESTIEKLEKRGVKVEYLNITQLSTYREDAHPSIYTKHWKHIIDPKFRDPNRNSDCLHWCLPGVPDVWNQILYSYIMKP